MIATLKGLVSEKLIDSVVVDVNGVGYGLLVPLDTYSRLVVNEEAKFYIYEHIRENSYDLYGFIETDSKSLFELLIGVNGVGPKVGLSILSIGSAGVVRQSIAEGNTKLIQTAPGVGKRVAERIVIDLKDKVGLLSSVDDKMFLTGDNVVMQSLLLAL
jgi:Holliday junction DNA helicase RuvA